MKILYISPEFPENFQNFVIRLCEAGVDVYAVGSNDFYSMSEKVRSAIKYYINTNLENYNDLKNAIHYMMTTCHIDKFDYVESHNEHWLYVESKINEDFNIPGIKPNTLGMWKKKSIMKDIFKANGLPHAKGRLVGDLHDAIKLAQELHYPVILKPDIGVGACGVKKIKSQMELEQHFEKMEKPFLMEECLKGTLVTYDGLTDKTGKIIYDSSFVYNETGVLDYLSGNDPACYIRKDLPPELIKLGQKVVKIFKVERKFFHLEFFDHNGVYTPVEVNSRPPGGHIIDMMNYGLEEDLYKAWADMIADKKVTLKNRKYLCGYFGRQNKNYKTTPDELYKKYAKEMITYFVPPALYWETMGKHIYIFKSEMESTILNIIKDGLETI
ncbi:MAG: hypothetical protein A2381_19160 [Bdellovibrionales bacterium RIFOXYB1_FULL_37_110]|nr:MAG: hypothetical protein A2181_09430 [Bdellovibrionales bacterium RIFOXYA1_FULL_38_20]OFZ49497.1 MAG: hypothetical protein A2417_04310 [Bdellovibrionales bacterium RIFOXYC1_FULL_37_79]OFZ58651.1 MAG: hypothetical protein A2381_19160 [Bdellovibrionales bacterium RIFOXYB1_FULL_37_110]